MKRMKTWHATLLIVMTSLCFASCSGLSVDQEARLNGALTHLKELTAGMQLAYKKFENGDLTAKEFKDLTTAISTTIETTKEEVVKLKAEGVSWWGMIVTTVVGLISRGTPSKGPAGMIFDFFSRRRKPSD